MSFQGLEGLRLEVFRGLRVLEGMVLMQWILKIVHDPSTLHLGN